MSRVCYRDGCNNIITDAIRPDKKMYCSQYCCKRQYDLTKRTPKKYLRSYHDIENTKILRSQK